MQLSLALGVDQGRQQTGPSEDKVRPSWLLVCKLILEASRAPGGALPDSGQGLLWGRLAAKALVAGGQSTDDKPRLCVRLF